jgi:UDP-N-acetylmuramoylalanine--D-glutamate ligase
VVGLGRSARAVVDHLVREGAAPHVVDQADTPALRREAAALEGRATVQLGGYEERALDGCNLVVASPGVPWDAPLLAAARQRQIPVSSELDLFFRACPAPIAGITGTNGKTTTTALAGAVLARGERPVVVGGNIGETVLDRLPAITPQHWVVLELSSFQLESITTPHLRIGAILNVTEDHLDRHRTMAAYTAVKARAISFMDPGDHAVLNFDDPTAAALSGRTAGQVLPFSIKPGGLDSGVCLKDGAIVLRRGAGRDRVMAAGDVPLPGAHNLSNALAAIAIGWAAGISADQMAEAVRGFTGVEHRIELVGTFAGVRYYNDSKATNPDSTLKALAAFEEPIVLIAGGRAKGADLEPLIQAIRRRVRHVVVIGETADELERRIRDQDGPPVQQAGALRAAVRAAAAVASPGSVVLLSPAFASYDMFENYEDRGRRFKEAVREELVGAH